jgi:hypothetical protein
VQQNRAVIWLRGEIIDVELSENCGDFVTDREVAPGDLEHGGDQLGRIKHAWHRPVMSVEMPRTLHELRHFV